MATDVKENCFKTVKM